jgi:hypothetical protein
MNAPDDQYVVFKFDFPYRFGYETLIRLYLARFQRAPEG